MWKKGIYHGDISLENLMWDDRRKVGVLNDFDLAKFAGQTGASGQDNTGTLPFMALDLLSEEGLRGEIPRRYRHEAESFAWSLICLYYGAVEDEGGRICTRDPHPLLRWFADWEISLDAKKGLDWHRDIVGIPPAHPNTKDLGWALHKYWIDRFTRQFPYPKDRPETVDPGPWEIGEQAEHPIVTSADAPPYEEKDDNKVFVELAILHEKKLGSGALKETRDLLGRMYWGYVEIDWSG